MTVDETVIEKFNDYIKTFIEYSAEYLSHVGQGSRMINHFKDNLTLYPKQLFQPILPDDFIIKASVGKGRITASPWIAILNKNITRTTREGIYVVFLFSEDLQKIYITLAQGVTYTEKHIILSRKVEISNQIPFDYCDTNIIGDKSYKDSVIFCAEWNLNDSTYCKKVFESFLAMYIDKERVFLNYCKCKVAKKNKNTDSKTVNKNPVLDDKKPQLTKPIDKYIVYFSSLHVRTQGDMPAPHKAILLISIIDLIEKGRITTHMIDYAPRIKETFMSNWERYIGKSITFRPNVDYPYWHMRSEPFWKQIFKQEYIKNGEVLDECKNSKPKDGNTLYLKRCELDKELFELLQDSTNRARLRVTLIKHYCCNIR